jgi:hypothetical protein
MSEQLGGTPNIPTGNFMDFLPETKQVDVNVRTNSEMNAQDPNIPKVALKVPDFIRTRIRNPEAVAKGELPSAAPTTEQSVSAVPFIPTKQAPQFTQDQPADLPIPPTFGNMSRQENLGSSIPAPQNGSVAGSVKLPPQPIQHGVLSNLIAALKSTADDIRSVEVDGFVFKMRPLSADLYAYAMSLAQRASSTQGELAMRFNMVRSILALISVNDEPIYKMFDMNTSKYQAFEDWAPPVALVVAYSPRLIDLFFNKLRFKTVEAISAEYDKYDESDSNTDLLAPGATSEDDERWRFKCGVPGCKHHEDIVPTYLDASKESVQPRFCPAHGEVLTPIGLVKDLGDIPLE